MLEPQSSGPVSALLPLNLTACPADRELPVEVDRAVGDGIQPDGAPPLGEALWRSAQSHPSDWVPGAQRRARADDLQGLTRKGVRADGSEEQDGAFVGNTLRKCLIALPWTPISAPSSAKVGATWRVQRPLRPVVQRRASGAAEAGDDPARGDCCQPAIRSCLPTHTTTTPQDDKLELQCLFGIAVQYAPGHAQCTAGEERALGHRLHHDAVRRVPRAELGQSAHEPDFVTLASISVHCEVEFARHCHNRLVTLLS
mmetsp:Transcript_115220/g.366238  ORF Transcript_115220/g.366238 Transcript_115220/m.366238 type:complete len:256 (+) Transcript_115220:1416-2183(+)